MFNSKRVRPQRQRSGNCNWNLKRLFDDMTEDLPYSNHERGPKLARGKSHAIHCINCHKPLVKGFVPRLDNNLNLKRITRSTEKAKILHKNMQFKEPAEGYSDLSVDLAKMINRHHGRNRLVEKSAPVKRKPLVRRTKNQMPVDKMPKKSTEKKFEEMMLGMSNAAIKSLATALECYQALRKGLVEIEESEISSSESNLESSDEDTKNEVEQPRNITTEIKNEKSSVILIENEREKTNVDKQNINEITQYEEEEDEDLNLHEAIAYPNLRDMTAEELEAQIQRDNELISQLEKNIESD